MQEEFTRSQSQEESVGHFLLRRLVEVGVHHLFGVAGNSSVELLDQLQQSRHMEWVGCRNELNASYAADGYARSAGAAALLTTYGVGELSALCGVAGAYVEHVSIVVISGAPPISEMQRKAFMHHVAVDGNSKSMMPCAQQFSIAHALVTPQNAVVEIDRCLRACLLEKRPVYLQLPLDIPFIKVSAPTTPLTISFESDPDILDAFIGLALAKIRKAKSWIVLVGADVDRFGLTENVMAFVSKMNVPVAVTASAKGVIDETYPQYLGVYTNNSSSLQVQNVVEGADCVLMLGIGLMDATPSEYTRAPRMERQITVSDWFSKLDDEDFSGICLGDVVRRLDQSFDGSWQQAHPPLKRMLRIERDPSRLHSKLTRNRFWHRMESFILPGDVVLAEIDTSLSGIVDTLLPSDVKVIAQPLWGAMGYTLPATFGSLMALPHRRHLLFISSSSFQFTAQELSSILHSETAPIIFLITSNSVKEYLGDNEFRSYDPVQSWQHSKLCAAFADYKNFWSQCVSTISDLEAALSIVEGLQECSFIEVQMA